MDYIYEIQKRKFHAKVIILLKMDPLEGDNI